MNATELARQLLEFSRELRLEQHWHNGVRKVFRDSFGGESEVRTKATELLKRSAAIRQGHANQLRDAATETPQSIKANLYKLAIRLETTADDVSDELCEVAAAIQETLPEEQYPDPDNQERNHWLYQRRKAGATSTSIFDELERLCPDKEWNPITTVPAITNAVNMHAEWLGVDPPKGKSGRPKKS